MSVEIQKNHLYLINMGNKKIKNLPHEIWKDIKGYEGRYKISNRGRVKSLSHLVTRGFATCMTDEIICHWQRIKLPAPSPPLKLGEETENSNPLITR